MLRGGACAARLKAQALGIERLHTRFGLARFVYLVSGGSFPVVPGSAPLLGEVATAWGFAAEVIPPRGARLTILVEGEFAREGDAASNDLLAAWSAFAKSDLGHGLDAPTTAPVSRSSEEEVGVTFEIDLRRFAEGLGTAAPGGLPLGP